MASLCGQVGILSIMVWIFVTLFKSTYIRLYVEKKVDLTRVHKLCRTFWHAIHFDNLTRRRKILVDCVLPKLAKVFHSKPKSNFQCILYGGKNFYFWYECDRVCVSVSKMVEISINSHWCIIKLSTQTDQQQQRRQKQIAKTNENVWPERVFLHALSNTIFPTATHYSVFNAFSHKRKHCLHQLFHSH